MESLLNESSALDNNSDSNSDNLSCISDSENEEQIFCYICGSQFSPYDFVTHYFQCNLNKEKTQDQKEPKNLDEIINKIALEESISDLIEAFNKDSKAIYKSNHSKTACSSDCNEENNQSFESNESLNSIIFPENKKIRQTFVINQKRIKKVLKELRDIAKNEFIK